jgi:hypothetical protein
MLCINNLYLSLLCALYTLPVFISCVCPLYATCIYILCVPSVGNLYLYLVCAIYTQPVLISCVCPLYATFICILCVPSIRKLYIFVCPLYTTCIYFCCMLLINNLYFLYLCLFCMNMCTNCMSMCSVQPYARPVFFIAICHSKFFLILLLLNSKVFYRPDFWEPWSFLSYSALNPYLFGIKRMFVLLALSFIISTWNTKWKFRYQY